MEKAPKVHPPHDFVGWAAETAIEKDANEVVDSMLHKIPDVSTESPAVREQVARLDRTILSLKNKFASQASDHPVACKAEVSISLGHAILERYSITASQDDFREAIHSLRSVRRISGQPDDQIAAASLGIARCYCQRYQHFGSSRDRVLAQTEFSRLCTQDHASAALPYLGLLTALEAEYNPRIDEIKKWLDLITIHLSHLESLTDEIAKLNIGAEPTSSPSFLREKPSGPANTGVGLSDRLEGPDSAMRQTSDSTSSFDLLICLEAQGRLLLHRSRLLGIYPDLNVAISIFNRCLGLLSEKPDLQCRFRILLAETYRLKFEFSEDDALFQEATIHISEALSNPRLTQRERLSCLLHKAELLFMRSSYYPSRQAILMQESYQDANLAQNIMQNMASPLVVRLKLLLTRLISQGSHPSGMKQQFMMLELLHNAFWDANLKKDFDFQSQYCRSHVFALQGHEIFQEAVRSRDSGQLNKAISLMRDALQPSSYEAMQSYTSLYWERAEPLCYALLKRIDAFAKGEDYSELCRLVSQYVSYPAPIARQMRMELLTTASRVTEALAKANQGDEVEYLSVGIDFLVQKVSFETKHAQVQSYRRRTLAGMYQKRGKARDPRAFFPDVQPETSKHKDRTMGDLRAAVDLYREDMEYWAKCGSSRPHASLQLSAVLFGLFKLTQDGGIGKEALHLAYAYLTVDNIDTVGIMEATERIGDLEIALNADWECATRYYDRLVDVFRSLVTEGHLVAEKRRFLMEWSVMPMHAATTAITAQRPLIEVLERLETTRSLFWDRHFNQMEDLERLKRERPSLHQDLMESKSLILKHLRKSSKSLGPGAAYHGHVYDNIVRRIQQETGFENFMRWSLSEKDLKCHCAEGPIITVVHSSTQSYAVVATVDGISSVPINGFNELDGARKYNEYVEAIRLAERGSDEARPKLLAILKWLWEVAAKPILSFLGLIPSKNKKKADLPRIWWVTGGWIGAFPIHAAGDYEGSEAQDMPCSVMDCVVSAYTPTLRALLRSRDLSGAKSGQEGTVPQEALLISVPNAGSLPPLQFAAKEVEEIGKVLQPNYKLRTFIEPQAKTQDAIDGLKSCTIAHFACHGEAAENPMESQLHLADSFKKPLRVAGLMKVEIRNCHLAYLSACESALNREWRLRNENLHLAAALQMAGIPCVVGTWWKIIDQKGAEMAKIFYENLVEGQTAMVAGQGNAARALHGAVVKMRNDSTDPFIWGAYAYYGS